MGSISTENAKSDSRGDDIQLKTANFYKKKSSIRKKVLYGYSRNGIMTFLCITDICNAYNILCGDISIIQSGLQHKYSIFIYHLQSPVNLQGPSEILYAGKVLENIMESSLGTS